MDIRRERHLLTDKQREQHTISTQSGDGIQTDRGRQGRQACTQMPQMHTHRHNTERNGREKHRDQPTERQADRRMDAERRKDKIGSKPYLHDQGIKNE